MDKPYSLCKNCGEQVHDKYCSHCGQLARTDRINLHYMLHELQHSVLHVDKGIFYTIKELLIRPGYAIRDYLEGKRVYHFKPFAFILILGAIYAFIIHLSNKYPEAYLFQGGINSASESNKIILEWIYSHYSLVMFILIPISALSSYLTFRKSGYNYMEHIIIYSYITGMHIILLLVIYPFYYLTMSAIIYSITFIIGYIYNIWVLSQLFRKASWIGVISKALFSVILSTVFMFILTVIVSLIIVYFKIYIP